MEIAHQRRSEWLKLSRTRHSDMYARRYLPVLLWKKLPQVPLNRLQIKSIWVADKKIGSVSYIKQCIADVPRVPKDQLSHSGSHTKSIYRIAFIHLSSLLKVFNFKLGGKRFQEPLCWSSLTDSTLVSFVVHTKACRPIFYTCYDWYFSCIVQSIVALCLSHACIQPFIPDR